MRFRWLILGMLLAALLAPSFVSTQPVLAQQGQQTHGPTGRKPVSNRAQYGTTWPALAAANNITNPNPIYVGQVLIIPGGTAPGTTPCLRRTRQHAANLYGRGGGYAVEHCDTFTPTVTALVQANGIVNPNLIYVGQVLTIAGGAADSASGPQSDHRARPADRRS